MHIAPQKGVVYYEWSPKNVTITAEVYCQQLPRLGRHHRVILLTPQKRLLRSLSHILLILLILHHQISISSALYRKIFEESPLINLTLQNWLHFQTTRFLQECVTWCSTAAATNFLYLQIYIINYDTLWNILKVEKYLYKNQ